MKKNVIESDLFSLVAVNENETLMQLLNDDVIETERGRGKHKEGGESE